MVDGVVYSNAVTLNWGIGTKHLLVFITDPPIAGQSSATSIQTSSDGSTQYAFTGWVDNASLLVPTTDPVQTVTANPAITTLTAKLQVAYRILLNFYNSTDGTLPVTCGAPGAIPPGIFRPGVVFLGSQCYWTSANVFVPAASPLNLNAFPYPGFVFMGWALNSGPTNAYLSSVTVNSPMTIAPQFSPGKRVHFLTNPLGMNVLVDHTVSPTRSSTDVNGACPFNEQEPIFPQTGFPPMCFGDFDFAPGSTHVISGVSPQLDAYGNYWVFNNWSNGTGANALYKVDNNTAATDTLTATFVAGAHVGFLTNPTGLKLTVDGTQNWPGYNFIWGLGQTHTVTAAATQTDAKGRKYTFQGWSNAGGSTQTITVDQSAVTNGLLLTASYSELSRVVVQSSPTGIAVQVDGASDPSWVTPFALTNLQPGQHSIMVSKAGYSTDTRTVNVTSGNRITANIRLAQLMATLVVKSDPPGANIYVDGRDMGTKTPAQVSIDKWQHLVLVRMSGYLDETQSGQYTVGQTYSFTPTLRALGNTDNIKVAGGKMSRLFGGKAQANQATVSIHTSPKGAQVSINRHMVEKNTPVDLILDPGNYEVEIELSGYAPIKKIVTATQGGKVSIDETLQQQ